MIFDILMIAASWVLAIVHLVLGSITYALGWVSYTLEINEAWTWAFSYLNALSGVFPVETAVNVITFLLGVWAIKYVVQLIFMGLHIVPWVGTKQQAKLPES